MDLQIYKAPQRGKAQKLLEEGFHLRIFLTYHPIWMGNVILLGLTTEVLPRSLTRYTKRASLKCRSIVHLTASTFSH
jgi:hypothetical protein